MPLENLGFVAMGGWQVFFVIVGMLVALLIPGYLLTLALFPKKDDLEESERIAMSLPLGLTPVFLLTVMRLTIGFNLSFIADVAAIVAVCALSVYVCYRRGGKLPLIDKAMKKS